MPRGSTWFLAERKLFLWSLYHHFGSVGDPTHPVSMTSTKWRALLSRSGCIGGVGKSLRHRDSVVASEEVDSFFYTCKC